MIGEQEDQSDLVEVARRVLGSDVRGAEQLPHGKNNQSFKLITPDGPIFAKRYFRHPLDPRSRLDTEFTILDTLWRNGVRSIAQPLAAARDENIAFYAYLEAKPFSGTPSRVNILEAATFYARMNELRNDPEATNFPYASEAAFSLSTHLTLLKRRMERLTTGSAPEALAEHYHELSREVLPQATLRYEVWLEKSASESSRNEDCAPFLSPSDFGFHNVLVGPTGSLYFVDFEYAGWDDPARTVCDFFLQPRIPVERDYLQDFIREAFQSDAEREVIASRYEVLLPLCALRWCCILLNPSL